MKKNPSDHKTIQYKTSRQRNKVSIRKAKISYLNRRLYKPLRSGNSKSFHKYLRICRANGSSVIPHLTYKKETIKIPGQKLIISPEGILQLLKDLDANKACGPDNLTGRMLKHISPVIYFSFAEIFSHSLTTWTFPSIWKLARVQPVHKKGSKHLPNNYQPISLTRITCKVLEQVIPSHVYKLLSTVSFFDDGQHGF